MFKGVLATTDIQRIAIGKKRLAPKSLDSVGNGLGEIGAQEGKIARFAKVHLDSYKFVFKINGFDTCRKHELVQLFQQTDAHLATHIGKKHF